MLVQTRGLTPWKGGGFGLFSTIDKGDNRQISCMAQDTTGRLCRIVLGANEFRGKDFGPGFLHKLLAYPDPKLVHDFGRMLLDTEYEQAPTPSELVRRFPFDPSGRLHFESLDREPLLLKRLTRGTAWRLPPEKRVRIQAIRLTVWRLQFDPQTTQMKWQRVGKTIELGK